MASGFNTRLTLEQRHSALKCAATLQRKTYTPRWHFQNKRCDTAGNQLKKMTFFTLPHPHFTEEYPGFGLCTLIEPEGLSTNLHVFANEQMHIKWNFARIKSSTTALQPAATFTSSKAS
jgi:hypothetical protein